MPSLVVANSGQLRLIWSMGGSLFALNVLGVVNSGSVAITQTLANTIGAAIKGQVAPSGLGASMHTSIALANIGLRDLRTAGQGEFLDVGAPVSGTGADGALPPQVALCVTLRTAQVGASYRGRVYLCGFDESVNTSAGAANGGTGAATFVSAIQAALQASGLNLGVLSRPAPNRVPPSVGFITPVTSIVIRDQVWDTQRRRAVPGI